MDNNDVVLTTHGKEFTVKACEWQLMGTIKDVVDDAGTDVSIPLPNMTVPVLEQLLTFCRANANPKTEVELIQWNEQFISGLTKAEISDLVIAANYVDLPPLLTLGCSNLSSSLRGKSTKDMRAILGVQNDWAAEEEETIRKENAWCEDA